MRYPWNNHALKIGEYRFHGLAALRRARRKRIFHLVRFVLREDGITLGVRKIIRNPVDELMTIATKVGDIHIAERVLW